MHRESIRRAAGFLARVLSRAILPATLALSSRSLLPAPARGSIDAGINQSVW